MHVEIKSEENTDKVRNILDQEEMEEILMKNFKEKILEVYNTNTTMEPLLSILGTDRLTAAAEDILQGKFVFTPVVLPDIIEFFSHMKISDKIMKSPPIKMTTMLEDF